MANCRECGRSVSGDEMGLNLKLIDRQTTSFLCISCMAGFFRCDEGVLREKIRRFKEIGCKLFPSEQS